MTNFNTFLAMDFGAESGRAELITLKGRKITMKEIHRFPNRPVRLAGTLYWDLPSLYAEILTSLKICAEHKVKLAGMGIDTWGVDFGLLDKRGKLLSNPVHYRDQRTNNIHRYSGKIMSNDEIFAETGCEPWAISSLFQLLAMKKEKSPLLSMAKTFLNIPDLFNYLLTGKAFSERSIASTSNLHGINGKWCRKIIKAFNLPDIFPPMIEPATVLGEISDSVQIQTGSGPVKVVATCGHDTAAVAAAIPAQGKNWAFLSCGTWSILGQPRKKPISDPKFLKKGFSNEYTLDGWFSCRNILGLWLIQELRRKWNTEKDPWDYNRMTAEAAKAKSGPLVNVADRSLLAPADMEKALINVLRKSGEPPTKSRGELVKCVIESLALEYALSLKTMDEFTGEKTKKLYMIGGGTANKLLCQATANACGIPVLAGMDQCTSLGNAMTQAVALGILPNGNAIRTVMRNSFKLTRYEPKNKKLWAEKIENYWRLAVG